MYSDLTALSTTATASSKSNGELKCHLAYVHNVNGPLEHTNLSLDDTCTHHTPDTFPNFPQHTYVHIMSSTDKKSAQVCIFVRLFHF
jgi:hypothetical protein